MDIKRVDMEKSKALLKKLINRRMSGPGDYETGLDGVRLYRRDQPSKCASTLYRPAIIKMVQGNKRAIFGNEEFSYGENEVMVAGVDMPGMSLQVDARPETPSTSIAIDLDKNLIAQLAIEIPYHEFAAGSVVKGILVQSLDAELLDAFLRLAELFDKPEKLPVLGPMVVREIHYLLLIGPNGHRLRSFHTLGSQSNQVARAITWLKQHMADQLHIDQLAEQVNMAPSTFHRHFKDVTTLSPLQFQKRLRLHEAQRLMLTNDLDASSACVEVGYESLSQFNREYKRLFGEPPARNVKRMRLETILASPRGASAVELQGG